MAYRVNLTLPDTVGNVMERLCTEWQLTRPQLVRQALGVLQVVHDAGKSGRYVGTSLRREALDTVIALQF